LHWSTNTTRSEHTVAGNTPATSHACLAVLLLLPGCELDSQSPDFTVSPTSGLVTTENGGTAEFDIVLNAKPDALVTVEMRSSNPNEGVLSKEKLSFSPDNWAVPQTVSIKGVDDNLTDGDAVYHIDFPIIKSDDKRYKRKSIESLAVVNMDNEAPQNPPQPIAEIRVDPSGILVTSENNTSAAFSVTLASRPTSDVTIYAASSDSSEGIVSPLSYRFTDDNWNSAARFIVTGRDDAVADGTVHYTVQLAVQSNDTSYNGITIPDVQLDNLDDDVPGITISANSTLETSEDLTTADFTVVLNTMPAANVALAITSSDITEGVASPVSLTFTVDNWDKAQTVTVRGVDDSEMDGDKNYNIGLTAQSTDAMYNGMVITPLAAVNRDNESNAAEKYDTSVTARLDFMVRWW